MDAGGGNGLKGRPLESYRVDILTLFEVQNKIENLIRKLENKHEAYGAKENLRQIVQRQCLRSTSG